MSWEMRAEVIFFIHTIYRGLCRIFKILCQASMIRILFRFISPIPRL